MTNVNFERMRKKWRKAQLAINHLVMHNHTKKKRRCDDYNYKAKRGVLALERHHMHHQKIPMALHTPTTFSFEKYFIFIKRP
jgi:hypothetical protein